MKKPVIVAMWLGVVWGFIMMSRLAPNLPGWVALCYAFCAASTTMDVIMLFRKEQ
jgi:hypothetical protein